RNKFSQTVHIQAPMHLAVQHRRRGTSTQAETVDRFQGYCSVQRRLVEIDAEQLAGCESELVSAHCLAGLGATELQHMSARGRVPEVVVEGDHAMNLGSRQVEFVGNDRLDLFRDEAELALESVEDRQHRAFQMLHLADDGARAFGISAARHMYVHGINLPERRRPLCALAHWEVSPVPRLSVNTGVPSY